MKKKTPAQLKKQLWALCKQIILKRYGNDCYTCGAKDLQKSNCQLGHFIPSSVGGVGLRFDLDNLRIQCYRCNIHLSGNWPNFYQNMVAESGKKKVDALLKRKTAYTKADSQFYLAKIAEYGNS